MKTSSKRPVAGHTFLSKLGKTRLRPGGIKASQWLFDSVDFNSSTQVLEVACNKGTSILELVKKKNIQAIACDLDEDALAEARANAKRQGLDSKVSFMTADARALPFADGSFDVVINEAMLTMQSPSDKLKAIQEYYRVLKPNGVLLTHDVLLNTDDVNLQTTLRQQMTRELMINVHPLSKADWLALFESCGFEPTCFTGKMSLMNPIGMIRDEGFKNTFRIIRNALKKENKPRFMSMFKLFKTHDNELGFIAVSSRKQEK